MGRAACGVIRGSAGCVEHTCAWQEWADVLFCPGHMWFSYVSALLYCSWQLLSFNLMLCCLVLGTIIHEQL